VAPVVIKKATKSQSKLRLTLTGPAGSGKTYTALGVAKYIADKLGTGRVCVIDTERGSAAKYSDEFDFDVIELTESHHPQCYIDAIDAASVAGYDVLVIDSLSHAWAGRGGALELVTEATKKSNSNNKYTAWQDVTPLQNALTDKILSSKAHVIATLRSKTEYVLQANERGKMVPVKMGLTPIQREGLDHEFDVVMEMHADHSGSITKTRCKAIADKVFEKPGEKFAAALTDWLSVESSEKGQPTSDVLGAERSGTSKSSTPTDSLSAAPTPSSPQPIQHQKFIDACDKERARVGNDAFDELLRAWVGHTDPTLITDRETQRTFYVALKKLPVADGVDPLLARLK